MRTYRMSGIGCQRVIAAEKMGYEPAPFTEAGLVIMEESIIHEGLVREKLRNAGIEVLEAGVCQQCLDEFKESRGRIGFHVEYKTPLIRAIGHLDGKILYEGQEYVWENKALGRFTWDRFKKTEFDENIGYANQIGMYLKATGFPGAIYTVKSRDTGQILIYSIGNIPEGLMKQLSKIKGTTLGHIAVPDIQPALDKLNWVELCIRDDILPDGEYELGSKECRWCNYKFLCIRGEEEKEPDEVVDVDIVTAAMIYKEAYQAKQKAESEIEENKLILLRHAIDNKIPKYKVPGFVNVSYSGVKTKKIVDTKLLKELVSEEICDKVIKDSRPWDDIRITVSRK